MHITLVLFGEDQLLADLDLEVLICLYLLCQHWPELTGCDFQEASHTNFMKESSAQENYSVPQVAHQIILWKHID